MSDFPHRRPVIDRDTQLSLAVNARASQNAALDAVMVAVARGAPRSSLWRSSGSGCGGDRRDQRAAALAGGAALLALGIGQCVGMLLPRARPNEVLPSAHLRIAHAPDTSFPSDHAILTFAVAVGVCRVHRTLRAVLLVLACWTAVTRVFVGVHYPGDALGGAVLGAAVMAAVWRVHARPPVATGLDGSFAWLRRVRVAAP